jgi:hypothetical protein
MTVAVPVRVLYVVLLPEQKARYALAAQLNLHTGPVRKRANARLAGTSARKESGIEVRVAPALRKRPGNMRSLSAANILVYGA